MCTLLFSTIQPGSYGCVTGTAVYQLQLCSMLHHSSQGPYFPAVDRQQVEVMHAIVYCSQNQQPNSAVVCKTVCGPQSIHTTDFAVKRCANSKAPFPLPHLPVLHTDGLLNKDEAGETTCIHTCMGPHQQADSALQSLTQPDQTSRHITNQGSPVHETH